jgi:formylglycine-generating enzyme required for sulfatase activity
MICRALKTATVAGVMCIAVATIAPAAEAPTDLRATLVAIPGGTFVMGDAAGEPDEAPREVAIGPFRLMRHEVTVAMFARFAAASGHRTDPERDGASWVWERRWRVVKGADWRHPEGPNTDVANKDRHPVVQVSANDAAAFCAWYGLRLPTDPEWEFAARGTDGRRYPWGDDPPEQGGLGRANFGTVACCAADPSDGYRETAPVGSFPAGASPFGLLDMAGNVWEWTASPFPGQPGRVSLRGGGWGNDPYCLRTSYRHGNPPDIGLDMVGFRCAADAAE